ncbi:MAG: nitrogen fixation/metabolism regulation signal transduction histidine kinase [Desulforhopalus sp.]|jgi:nitrogen fixation/metabolism regulation signal transduction histidine kinase
METTNTDRACVQVFAKISASISHEIKNTLSIINESAGLLEDFAQMAEEDSGVAVERVFSITKTITKQTDRANAIMKVLNRFAHSADTSLGHGNLEEILRLVMALTSRQADMKDLTMTLSCPSDIALATHLLSLESLVYLTLLTLFKSAEDGSDLEIEVTSEASEISMSFTLNNTADLSLICYPDVEQKLLAEQLEASWKCEKKRLFLHCPAIIS